MRSLRTRITIVSPGIRLSGASTDDHKRSTTPGEAIRLGADYLVVGRPIRSASDPGDAARRILDDMERALEHPGPATVEVVTDAELI